MLSAIGESPVSTLNNASLDVSLAQSILKETSVDIQSQFTLQHGINVSASP